MTKTIWTIILCCIMVSKIQAVSYTGYNGFENESEPTLGIIENQETIMMEEGNVFAEETAFSQTENTGNMQLLGDNGQGGEWGEEMPISDALFFLPLIVTLYGAFLMRRNKNKEQLA